MTYYAVVRGRIPGVYDNWETCRQQVGNFVGAEYRQFSCKEEAESYWKFKYVQYYLVGEDDSELCEDEEGFVNVYTDGACINNGTAEAKAGIGVFFSDNHYLNESKPLRTGRQTSNRAEIKAVTEAVTCGEIGGYLKLRIHIDSEYLQNCLTKWMKTWKTNGWKTADGKPVVNKEELLEMEAALKDLEAYKLVLVPAHSGIHGNEMADKLAKEGAMKNK